MPAAAAVAAGGGDARRSLRHHHLCNWNCVVTTDLRQHYVMHLAAVSITRQHGLFRLERCIVSQGL